MYLRITGGGGGGGGGVNCEILRLVVELDINFSNAFVLTDKKVSHLQISRVKF